MTEIPHWETNAVVRVFIFFLLLYGLEKLSQTMPPPEAVDGAQPVVMTGGMVLFSTFITHGVPMLLMMAACVRVVPLGQRLEAWGFRLTVPGLPAAALMRALPLVVMAAALSTGIRYGVNHFFELDLGGPLDDLMEGANRDVLMGLVISAVIFAPLAEEMFFRHALHSSFMQRMSETYADIFVSVIFAAVHMDVVGFIPLLIVGYALQRIRRSSGSLALPILVHAIFNAMMLSYVLLQIVPDEAGL